MQNKFTNYSIDVISCKEKLELIENALVRDRSRFKVSFPINERALFLLFSSLNLFIKLPNTFYSYSLIDC